MLSRTERDSFTTALDVSKKATMLAIPRHNDNMQELHKTARMQPDNYSSMNDRDGDLQQSFYLTEAVTPDRDTTK